MKLLIKSLVQSVCAVVGVALVFWMAYAWAVITWDHHPGIYFSGWFAVIVAVVTVFNYRFHRRAK